MKELTSWRSLERRIVPLLFAAFLFSSTRILLWAADDTASLPQKSAAAGHDSTGAGILPGTDDFDLPRGAASPSPSPSLIDRMLDIDEGTAPAKPGAKPAVETPNVEVQPPVPEESTNAEEAANNVPIPQSPPLQQQFSDWELSQVESPSFLSAAINEFNERPLLLSGKWDVKPHLTISSYYDGNIFLRSTDVQSDIITRIAPGLTFRLGDTDSMFYLVGDYTLGFDYYAEHPKESTVDNNGTIQAQWTMPKTTVGLTLEASQDTGQDIDVTDRVQQELYFAGLTTHYDLSEKTSWDVSADYTRSDFNGLISSQQAEGHFFVNYDYSPKTQVGIGGGGGVLIVPGTPQQTFEDGDLRATYRATGKITFIGEAGLETRQFGDGQGASTTPIFTIEGAWDVRPGTSVTADARRSIYASALLADQNYTATSFDVTVSQKVTKYFDVSLGAGYVNTDYSATATGVNAVREDNYFYIRPEVEWKALTWLSIGIFYEYSQDTSQGGVANSFTRDQGGVDLGIVF